MFTITYADGTTLHIAPRDQNTFHVRETCRDGGACQNARSREALLSAVPSPMLDAFEQWLGELQNPTPPKAACDLIADWAQGRWQRVLSSVNDLRRDAEAALLAERTQDLLDQHNPLRTQEREVQGIVDLLAGDAA